MTLHSRNRGRPGPGLAGVAKREVSYGPKSGPKAGSRASSPGEQAAACDYRKTRALGRGASRSLRLPNYSCAGLQVIKTLLAAGRPGSRSHPIREVVVDLV